MGGGPAHEVYPAAPADDSAKDPVSKFERRDHAVRQKLVQVETAKVVRAAFDARAYRQAPARR
jgi:hypothetical protein